MDHFKSIKDILDFAIQSEQEAFEFYSSLASNAVNSEMKAVFEQFAKEEMAHKAKLLNIKNEGTFVIKAEKILDLKIADYIIDIEPTLNMSYQDALILAMKKEKAAFKLYLNLADKATSSSIRDVFIFLAQEESKHKLRFEIEYDDLVFSEN